MPRRSTVVTLTLAVVTLSATVLLASLRLHRQAQLSDQIRVNWFTWTLACVAAYGGLALIGWWAVAGIARALQGPSNASSWDGPDLAVSAGTAAVTGPAPCARAHRGLLEQGFARCGMGSGSPPRSVTDGETTV